ncbi:MAG: TetR/AcrR family transcriptional regulator [Burkholderiaceae bacterium]
MDKPIVQSKKGKPASPKDRPRRADGAATRALILEATGRRLIEGGYANLNLRDIARDAGVNHALIGYHFHGKRQLVLAVLDEANRRLLARQERMYHEDASASRKWQQACEFYEEDLSSGFVRLQMELLGASLHDAELRAEFIPRWLSWHALVEEGVNRFIAESGLELPVSGRAIAAWISWFWIGMEAGMTLGITEEQGHHREALSAMATLLRLYESKPPKKRSAARKRAR